MDTKVRKNKSELIRELVEVDRFIKTQQSAHGGCYSTKEFAHLLTPGSNSESWAQLIESGRYSPNSYVSFVHRLKAQGYIRYTPKTKGGTGWTVNQQYVAGTDQEIKTIIIDRTANIASKLDPAKYYTDFHQMLVALTAKEPSLTVKELLGFLNERSDYQALATRPDNAGEETLNIQKELEQYRLDYITFTTRLNGEEEQTLSNLTLWQAYRVIQALNADRPKTSATTQPTKEAPIVIGPICDAQSGDDLIDVDDEAPFPF